MRWKLTIEYDGRAYAGWQRQKHQISVQEVVETALFGFCQQKITLHVAGRTDAGVHASGQVAHFDLDYGRPLDGFDLAKALNAHLRSETVSVIEAVPVPDTFSARYDALNKLYTYRILNRSAPPALEQGRLWHVRQPLNVDAMREASPVLLGKHDFSTFRAAECQAKSPIRTLDRLEVERIPYDRAGGIELRIHAEARSFLHHQVRNIVGSLVLVGKGRWSAQDLKAALDARDRTKGGPTCPSDGLSLVRIDYPVG